MAGVLKIVMLLMAVALAASQKCPDSDEISCRNEERCIPMRYICDSDTDCDDDADEDEDLCKVWRNDDCDRGSVKCRRGDSNSCISIQDYCSFTDPPCEGDLDIKICQMLKNNEVQRLNDIVLTSVGWENNLEKSERLGEEFSLLLNRTIEHERCPPMYTLVGDQCLSLFFIGSVSWGEARAFCEMIDGELVTFRNVSHFSALVSHLREAQVTADFWIGGRYLNETIGWSWVDESPMELGTPYWAVRYQEACQSRNVTFPELAEGRSANDECYNYVQAPHPIITGRCVSISYEHYYYMTDDDCLAKMSPLCVLSEAK